MSKYNYRPLPDFLTIKESPIDGLGVFATKDIKMSSTYNLIGPTHFIINGSLYRESFGGFVNHSNQPNCVMFPLSKEEDYEAFSLLTIMDIEAGEELTVDYNEAFKVLGIKQEIDFQ